jgi:hypothetical protein
LSLILSILRLTKFLAIRQLKGEHSGKNIAGSVLQVIKEYRIRDRIVFFFLDNASSNDVAVVGSDGQTQQFVT